MGMDLLNAQYPEMINYSEPDTFVPLDQVYKHYTKTNDVNQIQMSASLEKSTGKDTLPDFEENLLSLKKDKRRVQFRLRVQRLLDEENRIKEEEQAANEIDKVVGEDSNNVIDQSHYFDSSINNPLSNA